MEPLHGYITTVAHLLHPRGSACKRGDAYQSDANKMNAELHDAAVGL